MIDMYHYVVNIGASFSASTINYLIAAALVSVLLIIGCIKSAMSDIKENY